MRKTISIGFLFFYLLFSYGFVVSAHYCGGKMVSFEIMQKAGSCCGEEDAPCCATDYQVIFFDDNQMDVKTNEICVAELNLFQATHISNEVLEYVSDNQTILEYRLDIPPPDEEPYKKYCALTLYG